MKNKTPSSAGQLPAQFPLGQIVATPGALRLLERHGISPLTLLARHASQDWGVLPPEDATANNQALIHGDRVLSSYPAGDERVWIITEGGLREVTTILRPEDY